MTKLCRLYVRVALGDRSQPGIRDRLRGVVKGCSASSGALHAEQAGKEESMRAETENLVEEIKQSVRLLRRHL